jgi:histidinol dehydrogenase
MQTIKYPKKTDWQAILTRPTIDNSALTETVQTVLNDIKTRGDEAVKEYELKFDKVNLSDLQVSENEIKDAEKQVSEELKQAILLAKQNIEKFHAAQRHDLPKVETMPGVTCWQKAVAIEKVGLYIPGGTAPLFSTVLMLALPAQIAGCREIVLCSPPNKETGKIHPAVLYAASAAGVTKIYKIGGIQAIGAMAYGTESVPKVYKLFGPGNQYVTAAKQLVSLRDVAIDMPAGPSEVEVLADDTANPAFAAADLLSQAEHGIDSQSILITTSEDLAKMVMIEVEKQVEQLPRVDLARKALENSKIIIVKNIDEAIEMTNEYAPEHLIISTENYCEVSEKITNAGSIFLGHLTPESAGDYASGTNHTLPTNGYAKAYSGVNLDSFMKKITFQELTKEGLQSIGSAIEIMAENEQLMAHKNAVSLRRNVKVERKMRKNYAV